MKHFAAAISSGTLLLSCLVACSPQMSVEQQVISAIRDMEAAVEAGERRTFMQHVAGDFTGQGEIRTRDQVNALVLYQLHRHEQVHAQLLPIFVTPSGQDEAEARFHVLLTGGKGWLPEQGQMYEFNTRWKLREGDWMLTAARWKAAVLEDALDL